MTKALLVRELVNGIHGWLEADEYVIRTSDIRLISTVEESPCIIRVEFEDGCVAHIRVVSLEYFLQTIEWEVV